MYRFPLAALALVACDPDASLPPEPQEELDTGTGGGEPTAPADPPTGTEEGTVPGDEEPTDPATDPGADPGTDTDPSTVPQTDTGEATEEPPVLSYAADVEPILAAACAGCHLGGGSSGGFSFDAGVADLVGVTSGNGMPYVTAGDPAQSYLFHKLAGTQASAGGGGSRMPLGSVLSADDLDAVEAWVLDGALP